LIGTFWLTFGGSAVLAAAFRNFGIGFAGVSLTFVLTVLTMAYAIGHVRDATSIRRRPSGSPWAAAFPRTLSCPYLKT